MLNRKILVVDDEVLIRESVQLGLEWVEGWKVLKAGSGSDGFARARAEQPDAILLDVTMPGMDGTATLRKLQQDQATRHIPVIMLTALADEEDRRRYGEMGAAWLIAKPFDPMRLCGQVAGALGWKIPSAAEEQG